MRIIRRGMRGVAISAVATACEEPEEGQDGGYANRRGTDGYACHCTGGQARV